MPAAPPTTAAAPPPGVNIIAPPSPPKPPPAPTREIKLGAPRETGPDQTPAKPGSARDRMVQNLRAKAGIVTPTAEPTPQPPPSQSPAAASDEPRTTPSPGEETPSMTEQTPPAQTSQAPTTAEPPKGKTNPWKLVDQYKARTAELEKKLAESSTLPEAKQKEYLTRIEELQKHNEALENEIRFVNYQQHPEFKEKFQAPYEAAWQRAISELSEITINDPNTNAPRQASADDLAALLTVPLSKARELADQYFGAFADDVMAYRKEIKGLFDARAAALDDAKKSGAARDKERHELFTKKQQEMADMITQVWEKANQDAATHEKYGKYVTPVEGDQDGNQRLAKGFELVDRALAEFAILKDPKLTTEQRAAIVKRHAAVRNRAAAFGRLVSQIEKLAAEKTALEKELGQFKASTPTTSGGGGQPSATPAAGTARDQVFGKLRSLAR